MKKLLLLFLLFLSLTVYPQPPGMFPPQNVCDNASNDGYAVFDLTSTLPTILDGLDPSIHEVHFYPSDTDSANNTNEITNPNNYVNTVPGLQTLGIRIINTALSETHLAGMNLVVNPLPTANPGVLFFCDMMELPIYNLSDANAQITGGASGVSITYHETLTDAETGANPHGPNFTPIATPIQILYASVTNNVTGCRSITTLTLNSHNCGDQCPAPSTLTATNLTDSTFTLNWTNVNGWMGYIFNRISIMPQGVPASDVGSLIVVAPSNSYVLTGLQSEGCYSVYVRKACSTSLFSEWSAPLDICMPNCADSGSCAQALVLNAFLDSNNNGVKDSGEVDFNHGNFVYQVNDSGNNQYGTTNDGSYHIFDANPGNSYDISFAVNADFGTYYTSAVSHNDVTLPTGSGDNYLYFPIANPLPHVDAQVFITPNGQPRPGFTYSNTIYYQNNGSQTIPSGTLTFTKHPTIDITSVSQTGTTPTANGFTYDFINLAPFEVRYITVNLSVPTIPTVNLGDLVTNNVTVQIDNDINLSNNNSSITQTIVGSYDPNDKMESHGGKIVHSTFTSNDYLYYTIQFENTGTANAEFVRVEDALNNQLDENTFEMISASHNVDTKRVGSQLTWHFYNIDLPPTSSNPSGSHGFVYFRIKPKAGYAIGDIIPNTASIYFDYNPAIVTNTFNTEFVLALGNASVSSNEFNLYPNPAKGIVHIIQNSNQTIENVQFYDIMGKTVKSTSNVNNFQTSIDISTLAKGVYFVEISGENHIRQTKKLIIQ